MAGYGSIAAVPGPMRQGGNRRVAAATAGLVVLSAAACLVLIALAGSNGPQQRQVSLFQMALRVQQLVENKYELTKEDVVFLRHYDQCQSCLAKCSYYEDNHCDSFEAKKACLWEDLLAGCKTDKCEKKGCAPVIEYMDTNSGLIERYGKDEDSKAAAVLEMAWRDACGNAVGQFPDFEGCIHKASSVAHAENCLKKWLHPMPANMLSLAHKIAKAVGPPQCERSYTGSECEPTPKPEEFEGSCPQGFMCMPDPDNCKDCACSCNTPADKLMNLKNCLEKAGNPHAGSFCLATFFAQLPPDFVNKAIDEANQPEGFDEHYDQILAACGGEGNGTVFVTKCLEQVEYCVRPIQGKAGTFPEDSDKYQQLCACFRNPEVLQACGETLENQTECAGAIQEHYVYHVHHKYCLEHTESACGFQCEWPLPGFFGDVAKLGPEHGKEQFADAKPEEKSAEEKSADSSA